MATLDTIASLTAFAGRGAGSDAERRAALWLRDQLGGDGRAARIEAFWCRPNWALAHAWHALLALAGSLVSVSHPSVGVAVVALALVCVLADEALGLSPGRRLTREHASQNVVGAASAPESPGDDPPVLLILTANYDAGRAGLVYRDGVRQVAARLRQASGGRAPGWIAWLAVALSWLLVIALARMHGAHGTTVGLLQLPPTVALVLAIALLLELGSAPFASAASDNASGVAVVLALTRALELRPPQTLRVESVLTGAGDGGAIGGRRFLRAHRRELTSGSTIVLAIAACGAGRPRWWHSDGPLVPLAYHRRLRELCANIARSEAELAARAHRGRGVTPALPARMARLPSIAIGALDERGLPARSHQPSDTPAAIDGAAVDATLALALMLVGAIDADLASRGQVPSTPAASTPTRE